MTLTASERQTNLWTQYYESHKVLFSTLIETSFFHSFHHLHESNFLQSSHPIDLINRCAIAMNPRLDEFTVKDLKSIASFRKKKEISTRRPESEAFCAFWDCLCHRHSSHDPREYIENRSLQRLLLTLLALSSRVQYSSQLDKKICFSHAWKVVSSAGCFLKMCPPICTIISRQPLDKSCMHG
jgi:hypothetical protein